MLNAFILVVLILLLLNRTQSAIQRTSKEKYEKWVAEQYKSCEQTYNALPETGRRAVDKYLGACLVSMIALACLFYFYLGMRFNLIWFTLLTVAIIANRVWIITEIPHFVKVMIDSGFDYNLLHKFYPYIHWKTWLYTAVEYIYIISSIVLLVKQR